MTDYPISNADFANGLLDIVETGPAGTGSLTGEQARLNLQTLIQEWLVLSTLPQAQARKFASVLASWDALVLGFFQILTEPADGGPANDGIVNIQDHLGNIYPIFTYAKLASEMQQGEPGSTRADWQWGYTGPPPSGDEETPPVMATTELTLTQSKCKIACRGGPINDYIVRIMSNEGGFEHQIGTITVLAGQTTSSCTLTDATVPEGTLFWAKHPAVADPAFSNFTVVLSAERNID